jgi:hypothetical protein
MNVVELRPTLRLKSDTIITRKDWLARSEYVRQEGVRQSLVAIMKQRYAVNAKLIKKPRPVKTY